MRARQGGRGALAGAGLTAIEGGRSGEAAYSNVGAPTFQVLLELRSRNRRCARFPNLNLAEVIP
jgi:hypothetical protein